MRYEHLADQPCSITRPLVLLGDRWTLLLVKQCFAGVHRFTDLRTSLGIPRTRLVDRLARLVEHDILSRTPDGHYRLTRKGHDLYPVLQALRDWGDAHMAPDGPPVHYLHEGCGGAAHVHLTCDRCGHDLTARDVTVAAGPSAVRR